MHDSTVQDLVRTYFAAYQSKDRKVVEGLLGDGFTFTSPYDDHIDRDTYFKRCWPNSATIRTYHIRHLLAQGGDAFVLYECELMSGVRFRNTEHIRIEDGKIREVEVYFGELPERADAEAEICALIENRVAAARAKNVDGVLTDVAPDVLMFDVVDPLQSVGSDGVRKRAEQWFSSFDGPIGYEMRDLRITADDDVAFSHSLNRYSGTKTDGGKIDMWVRATVCYRRIDGTWRITHEHNSVPFDPASGKASLGLRP